MLSNWKSILTRTLLILWGLQILWLVWHFSPEARDLAVRIAHRDVGGAISREDPLYRWSGELAALIPPGATYVFLDHYEAGKAIEVRYQLAPRRHILLPPEVTAPFLFYTLHQEQADFLIIREGGKPLGPGVQAALQSQAVQPEDVPGAGLVYRVDPARLRWGFYD
jgi:hypothetical protein